MPLFNQRHVTLDSSHTMMRASEGHDEHWQSAMINQSRRIVGDTLDGTLASTRRVLCAAV